MIQRGFLPSPALIVTVRLPCITLSFLASICSCFWLRLVAPACSTLLCPALLCSALLLKTKQEQKMALVGSRCFLRILPKRYQARPGRNGQDGREAGAHVPQAAHAPRRRQPRRRELLLAAAVTTRGFVSDSSSSLDTWDCQPVPTCYAVPQKAVHTSVFWRLCVCKCVARRTRR